MVMYFHKPANALLPVSGTGGGEPVAQASPPGLTAAPPAVVPLPPVVPERPIPDTPPLAPQPGTTTAQKKQDLPGKQDPMPPAKGPIGQTTRVDSKKYTVLPERDKIFVIYDDAQLERIIMNTIREDLKRRKLPLKEDDEKNLRFPALEQAGAGETYVPKTSSYPPSRAYYNSLHVVHRRLHFEEKNAERYGWDLGFIQPLVSTLYFYKDVLLWPNSLASGCHYGWWDTNAGKCLPGSPTPYFLYPPGLTLTGTAFEGAVITGAAFIFP